MRELAEGLRREARQVDTAEPWVWLFEVKVNDAGDVFRLVNYHDPVTFEDATFSPFPAVAGSIKQDSEGSLPTVEVVAGNITRELSAQLELNNGFLGRDVRAFLVHLDRLADGAAFELEGQVLASSYNKETATFRVGMSPLMDYPIPRHRFLRSRCRWIYRSVGCGYAGALADCDKTLQEANGCEAHNNTLRFGGFPGIRRR